MLLDLTLVMRVERPMRLPRVYDVLQDLNQKSSPPGICPIISCLPFCANGASDVDAFVAVIDCEAAGRGGRLVAADLPVSGVDVDSLARNLAHDFTIGD